MDDEQARTILARLENRIFKACDESGIPCLSAGIDKRVPDELQSVWPKHMSPVQVTFALCLDSALFNPDAYPPISYGVLTVSLTDALDRVLAHFELENPAGLPSTPECVPVLDGDQELATALRNLTRECERLCGECGQPGSSQHAYQEVRAAVAQQIEQKRSNA